MKPPPTRRSRAVTLAGEWARKFQANAQPTGEPWSAFRDDPLRFFRDVLGFKPWSKQEEISRAVSDEDAVTVVSANGVGKTKLAAALALWFWRTRDPGCRVVLTSATSKHVNKALWREVRALYYAALRPLGGTMAQIASTGLRDDEGRELFGITAETVESFQGIRARELFIVADESSGIADEIFGAMTANLSGGGKLLLIGNGMRASGYFFETHRSDRFAKFAISALNSPNVASGRSVVDGLVTLQWCQERATEWGRDSAWYKIRVLGEFVEAQEGRLFTPEMIEAAEKAHKTTAPTGRLVIGIDPAGEGGDGDASGFAARRGKKIVSAYTRRALTPDMHVAEVLGLAGEHRGEGHLPCVVLDRDGLVGAKVYGALLAYLGTHPNSFALIGMRGSERAKRKPNDVHSRRDEIWFGCVDAFREGLAIPPLAMLEGDLAAIRFDKLVSGRATIIRKQLIRRELGRSPDLGDALALACWETGADSGAFLEADLRAEDLERRRDDALSPYTNLTSRGGAMDPWAGADPWRDVASDASFDDGDDE